MSAVSATHNTSAATIAAANNHSLSSDATEDRFLKLLIAQMKNQDPLNPLDNAQVTSQMAQINTVQGIAQLNSSLATMVTQFQGAQAISLPGHDVLVAGNTLTLADRGKGVAARGGFELGDDADHVGVDVKDAAGNVVAHIDLGAQSAGPGSFEWNGSTGTAGTTASAGNYTFEVKAYRGSAAVQSATLRAARVEGTAITAQGVRLSLAGMGSRYYSDVRMVL